MVPEKMSNAHSVDADEVLSFLKTNRETGLSVKDAGDRLSEYGPNRLEKEKGPSALRILVSQFNNALIVILLIATVISGILENLVDAIMIMIIVILVAALGFSQEYRTEKVLAALKKMQNHQVNLLRDGKGVEVSIEEIVPGDIVFIAAGDRISADMRVIESYNLLVDEAALTGESTQVEKSTLPLPDTTPIADQSNMLFSGTSVTSGKGTAVTISTGMRTELGKIAQKVTEWHPKSGSNIERRMSEIGRKIGILVLAIIIVIVTVSLGEEYYLFGAVSTDAVLGVLLFGVALAVAAIPEALPAILVGSLAIGAHRMARENALTRNLPAVETLGSTQIICTDKTGTLTKGEMTVTEIRVLDRTFTVSGVGYEPSGKIHDIDTEEAERVLDDMARAMTLCNDAVLVQDGDGKQWTIEGDNTEGALIVLAEKLGFSQDAVRQEFPRVWEIPFSSKSKRMTTVHGPSSGGEIAFMKGACESVLEKCSHVAGKSGVQVLDTTTIQEILGATEAMAARSLRVLAIATKTLNGEEHAPEVIERDFVFLGLVGMIDPPRPEAIEAIKKAKKVGVRPIMITGDHKTTALAIATQLGIYQDGDRAITGEQLQGTDDQEYEKILEEVTVYARVTPSDKLRIVEAWQKKDRIVAMTGDGVNDAPALKRADIGIAMGLTGTEVAKEASDMILLDDNFATILKAIRLGRWVQDNVKKYLAYLLSANLVEIVVLSLGALVASLFITNTSSETLVPLLAVQILYINLVTDGLPALAISVGPPEPDIMERPVQKKGETKVFSIEVRRFIYWILAAEVPLLFYIYLTGIPAGIEEARTRLFLAFVFVELILAINSNSLRFTFSKVKPHRALLLSVLGEVVLVIAMVMLPATRIALQLVTPTAGDIEWAMIAVVFTFIYVEILKRIFRQPVNT